MRSLPFIVDRVVLRVSAELADNVRDALRASINIDEIIDAFLATFPSDTPTRSQARDWARMNVRQNEKPLGKVLEDVWASGWVLGTDYATEAMRLATIKKAPTFSIDWSKWKPGQPAAEAIVRPPRGLKRLLQRNRNKTIKGISDTNLDRIGTVLADGLAAGADSRSVARQLMELGIKGILDDAKRALTIALTETSRAVGEATVERYQEMGLRRFEWITVEGEGVCEACDENAQAGPIPVGEAFPSGDYHEPAHPNCRCKMAPFIEGFSTPVREDAELGATADVVKYDEDQPRDENGRFDSVGSGDNRLYSEVAAEREVFRQQKQRIEEQVAVTRYTQYDYLVINQALRDGNSRAEFRTINAIDRLISNQEPTTEPTTVFRGVQGDIADDFRALQPGDTFTDRAFTSTSNYDYVARDFSVRGWGEANSMFIEIEIPAGSKVLDVDKYTSENGVTAQNESEVLLGRKSTFEVVSNADNNLKVRLVNG